MKFFLCTALLFSSLLPALADSPSDVSFDTILSGIGGSSTDGSCKFSRKELSAIDEEETGSGHDMYVDQSHAGDWACVEMKAHLKDDALKSCNPDPKVALSLTPAAPIRITGLEPYHFTFVTVKKRFSYLVATDPDGSLSVTVKIHFTGKFVQDPANASAVQDKLNQAAEIWKKGSPDGKIQFHFLSVAASENPDFTVALKPNLPGDLYDTSWDADLVTINYGKTTMAHELGHMMGIPDEYDLARQIFWQIKGPSDTRQCNIRALMCDPDMGKTYPYYYYLILRRAACSPS